MRSTEVNSAPREFRAPVIAGLVGPGRVGRTLLEIWREHAEPALELRGVARRGAAVTFDDPADPACWRTRLGAAIQLSSLDDWSKSLLALPGRRHAIVDATASRTIARRHARWLEQGFDVVTANKWAMAAESPEFQYLAAARRARPGRYHCATTVCAGLPVLETVRRIVRGGDRIEHFVGMLSGSLGRIIGAAQAGIGFAEAVRAAHAEGLTEPDPVLDLRGLDVARKLVIVAREAGLALDIRDVAVESLVPSGLPDPAGRNERNPGASAMLDRHGGMLDAHWNEICAAAGGAAGSFAYLAEFGSGRRARVGPAPLPAGLPPGRLHGTANFAWIRTRRYESPILILGPGAGCEITATQLMADLNSLD